MIRNHDIYYPLYTDHEHPIILITGGRGSGKTFSSSTFLERLTFEMTNTGIAHKVLYTRYTMVSAHISIIPEFLEKVELDNTGKYFHHTKTQIKNIMTGGEIIFSGIKSSSGNQTARLKSIHGITTFVCDEAEEWVDERDFETMLYSIRQKGIQNRVIIIMNPTDSNHFIYQRYIKDHYKEELFDGVPVQISTHPDVLHIHTTYLDNKANLSESFLREMARMKAEEPEKYAHIGMGRWADVREGAVFKHVGIVDEFPAYAKKVALAIDWGYTHDPTAIVKCGIVDNRLYMQELCYRTGMLASDIIRELRRFSDLHVIADSADPRLIDEVALGGVIIYPVEKGPGSVIAGIEKMLDLELFVTKDSIHLQEEFRNYVWAKDKDGNYINLPEDHDNHCFVGDTMVMTDIGERRLDEICVGDSVLTSNGLRKVVKFFDNGHRKILQVRITFGNFTIEVQGTPEHKVKTTKGWKRLDELTGGDVLYWCNLSTARNTTSTREASTSRRGQRNSIGLCGSIITEESRRVMKSTTRTSTPETTIYPTSNCSHEKSIIGCIKKLMRTMGNTFRRSEEGWTMHENSQINGMLLKREGNGIACTARKSPRIFNRGNSPANGAGRSIRQPVLERAVTAPIDARQQPVTIQGSITKSGYAPSAASPSCTTSISPESIAARNAGGRRFQKPGRDVNPTWLKRPLCVFSAGRNIGLYGRGRTSIAAPNALGQQTPEPANARYAARNSRPQDSRISGSAHRNVSESTIIEEEVRKVEILNESLEQVYDIEVQDAHEFFANGVLVHNCIDGCRYYCSAELLGKVMKPKAVTKADLGIY